MSAAANGASVQVGAVFASGRDPNVRGDMDDHETLSQAGATRILAGRERLSATERRRHQTRLATAERVGAVTRYGSASNPRYSRAEVQAFAKRLAEAQIKPRSRATRAAVMAAALGLLSASEVCKRLHVSEATVCRWGRRGLYGGRCVAGHWFFPEEELPEQAPSRSRLRQRGRREVACSGGCGAKLLRHASKVRDKNYCPECWPEARESHLAEIRKVPRSQEARRRIGERSALAFAEGRLDAQRQVERMREGTDQLLRSPNRREDRARQQLKARGYQLSDDAGQAIRRKANQLKQSGTPQAQAGQQLELWIRDLWEGPLTVEAIAAEVGVSRQRVSEVVRRLDLPRRPPGGFRAGVAAM